MNIQNTQKASRTYDAIVVGSGISGGWAAKELTEKGLKTLVLERGRDVRHISDYPTATKAPWELPHRGRLPDEMLKNNPIAASCYAFDESTEHFFVKDSEQPYVQQKPFNWIRGYQVGGKSLVWGRWTQRWSNLDFEANLKDGLAIDWPIRYEDLAPWYSYVERFVGISGNKDGIPHLPDGEFLAPMGMNCLETHFRKSIESKWTDRRLIISRTANLSQRVGDRGPCMYRDKCARGCPFGGYFSSNSATLPAAAKTGNLTLRPHALATEILYNEKSGKAEGVRILDTETLEQEEFYAKILFLNAGTLNTTALMLNSTSSRFPEGFGNDSGVLGHYLMDHNYRASLGGEYDGFQDKITFGKRPTGVYIPRFRNLQKNEGKGFARGYAFAAGGNRRMADYSEQSLGPELKAAMSRPSTWDLWMTGMGECLPYYENKVTLSRDRKDPLGMPQLEIDCEFKENELRMLVDILETGKEMLEEAGFINIYAQDTQKPPGLGIHEMGTARMGRDPQTSILNGHNQVWGAPNVFVTDGSCMTSSACQNPSLTYMALTARAVDYAINEIKKGNL
jgi:choline dehydrogenase-like flavoprotein